jgi:hypothetical protein
MIGAIVRALAFALLTCSAWGGNLTVVNGKYVLEGSSYRGVGVNYFDAIPRAIRSPNDRSALLGLRMLARYEVPFVRVMFGGFWPSEFELYQTDPDRYFKILDDFVSTAEQNKIGIVASLAWNYSTIPDLVGEPASAWGSTDSKTHQFFRKYVADVVGRYRASPAIWMWEYGNEMALHVDLPNSAQMRPKVDVSKGTRSMRDAADDLTGTDQRVALAEFVRSVRALDPKTPISSGNTLPRPFAYNNSKSGTWKTDTKEQFCEMLDRDNPVGYNVLSIHLYPTYKGYFGAPDRDYDAILRPLQQCATRLGKPVFAGEFGVAENQAFDDLDGARGGFNKLLGALLRNNVDLAAVWVFDFPFHEGSFNITPVNARAYQLEEIRQANRTLRGMK